MASIPGATPRMRMDAPTPERNDDDRRPGLTAASLFLVLIGFWIVTRVEATIVLGLFGLLLGTILEGPVRRLEERRIPRPAGIAMIYAAIIGMLVLLVFLIIPVIRDEANSVREDLPGQLENLEQEWRGSSNPLLNGTGAALIGQAGNVFDDTGGDVEVSSDAVQNVIPVISNITTGIIGVVTTLVITFYYLMEKAFIRRLVISQLDPRRQPRVERIWQDVENKVGGWMRGQLTLMLIIGVIATVSYGILDIRFWPLLGLWAGLTEIIPIVGPWIGGVPAVIVALTQGWEKALIVGLVIVGMQSLENWVLVPRVMRGAVGLTPLTVFVAILAGTQFMGVTGAILAIPIAAAIQVILSDYFSSRQLKREPQQQSGWRWMLSRAGARDDEGPAPNPDMSPGNNPQAYTGTNQTISSDVMLRPNPPSPEPPVGSEPPTTQGAADRDRVVPAGRQAGWAPFGPEAPPDTAPNERRNDREPDDS
ncbi:MAG: AI-2E family transporter [Chloroflexota bacterium]|nr:AI-2E family transporter [Chloroflexota bacterium]